MQDLLAQYVVSALAALVSAVLVPLVRAWLTAKIGAEQTNQLAMFARLAVQAAEQRLAKYPASGNDKMLMAQAALRGFTERHKLRFDDQAMSTAIEAAVLDMKLFQPQALTVETKPVPQEPTTPTIEQPNLNIASFYGLSGTATVSTSPCPQCQRKS